MKTNRLITFENAAFSREDLLNADKNNKRVLIEKDENSKKDIKTKKKNSKKNENEK